MNAILALCLQQNLYLSYIRFSGVDGADGVRPTAPLVSTRGDGYNLGLSNEGLFYFLHIL